MSQTDVDALQHREVALEPGAGVDARLRQRHAASPSGCCVELHEHEVPDLDVAVLAAVPGRRRGRARARGPRRSPSCGPHGPGVGHAPEVVRRRGAGSARPARRRRRARSRSASSSVVVHRDPEPVGVEAEHLGVELPRPRDRLGLEVVAEAEVAEHLEEREVAVRAADVVEVVVLAAGAHALLHRDRPRVRRRLVADEVRLERHHARDGEQQRLVVRDQARRRH